MKNPLLVTHLFDGLQSHRFVEEACFGEAGALSYAVLTTWRGMLKRRALAVVEIGAVSPAELAKSMAGIRAEATKRTGLGAWWRPQSWSWLLVGSDEALEACRDARLPCECLGHDPVRGGLEVLTPGFEPEAPVRDILKG